jgi:hypothetical protein
VTFALELVPMLVPLFQVHWLLCALVRGVCMQKGCGAWLLKGWGPN